MDSKKYFQKFNQYIRPAKVYLSNLKKYFIFAAFFFVFSFVYGYAITQSAPSEAENIIKELRNTYKPILDAGAFGQFLMIFMNNALVGFLTIVFGVVLGAFPLLVLFSNGMILGILAFLTFHEFSVASFLIGILPHGIIELPVMLVFVAIGLRMGHTVYYLILKKIFPKNIKLIARDADIRRELSLAFRFFVKFLIPLLLLAAAIEVFITAALL